LKKAASPDAAFLLDHVTFAEDHRLLRPLSLGERVRVRGPFSRTELESRPPHPALRADLSPKGEVKKDRLGLNAKPL